MFIKKINLNAKIYGRISITLLGVLLFNQALSRYDYIHVIPASLMALLVLFSLFTNTNITVNKKITSLVLQGFLIGVVASYIFLATRYLVNFISEFSPCGCYSRLERSGCVSISSDQEQAVEYIDTYSSIHETIFVGNKRHDKILTNDMGFYFLSSRQSATSYSELYPGVATTLHVQEKIARDILTKDTQWVVLVKQPDSREPNLSSVSSGINYLDDFININYEPVAEFGDYQILKKKAK